MGNLASNCVPVVPSEGGQGVDEFGDQSKPSSAAGVPCRFTLMSEVECTDEPPSTLPKVLTNAPYAMAFHKHLALTNKSENYEFFQAVSHYTHESCANKQLATNSARKIYNLYVSEAAPLRVALGDEIDQSIKKAIDEGEVSIDTFEAAQVRVLSLMENESLSTFLSSDTFKEVRTSIKRGEMDKLMQEDIERVKDIMSKEFIEFLGDPGMNELLSTQMGVDWFRQYLVIEFAEEGLDLLTATRDMLSLYRSKVEGERGREDRVKELSAVEEAGGTGAEAKAQQRVVEGASEGGEEGGVVAPAAEGEGGRVAAAEAEAEAEAGVGAEGGGSSGGANQGEEYDIRKNGKDLFERFIKSGCGAECNLPGTVVGKVSKVLDNDKSTPEEIVRSFEAVEIEIFKLLAYDPFLRFKRSGMYTKYCMKARLKTQRSSLTQVSERSQNEQSTNKRESCSARTP